MNHKTKTLSAVFAGLILVNIGGVAAFAAEVPGQTGSTPTTLTITDATSGDLRLDAVPATYAFETEIENGTYSLSTGTIGTPGNIVVSNDSIAQAWSVRATVANNQLTRAAAPATFDVNSFQINGAQLVGTGATGIVARSATTPDAGNNTGQITTPVTSIAIGFTDPSNVLQVNNVLNGTINYQLYNTADAS